MTVVDGHLDMAFNRFFAGRDPRRSALEIRREERDSSRGPFGGACMVGLPELRAGRVAVVFGTQFLLPESALESIPELDAEKIPPGTVYRTAEEAEEFAKGQLDFYRELGREAGSGFRMIGSVADLDAVLAGWEDDGTGDVGIVPLMEGADPIRSPGDAPAWFASGVRIVGLSWRRTRAAGGTGAPGPLTDEGRELLPALSAAGMVLDLSHAAEESFFEALELFDATVIASHSNPRALCPGDRQLSDSMISALASRGGIIGMVPYNRMLATGDAAKRVPMRRVAEAAHHVAQLAGTHRAVAIGSDFDGGFGAESSPEGLDTVADLPRLAGGLADLGFTDGEIADILGGNWIRLLREALPGS
ncbi:MAG: membrane dipeptidase [Gemmatimonadota bacterium]|nr:membrane dipeptidase [Gemmatimonadota bacterium]